MTAHSELSPWFEIPFDQARRVVIAIIPPGHEPGGAAGWDWQKGAPPMERLSLADAALCEAHTHSAGWCAVKDGVHHALPRLRSIIHDLKDHLPKEA